MRIVDSKVLNSFSPTKVFFYRIDPEDVTQTLEDILRSIMNKSWLSKFDKNYARMAFESRAQKTIEDIKNKFGECANDRVTSEAGEYVVSELARKTIVSQLNYLDIPLAELLGKKCSGNPGFDFHSQNINDNVIIFGEAKYKSNETASSVALAQIADFVRAKKDIEDLPDLEDFCSELALQNVSDKGIKGFAAAFSAKKTSTDRIIKNITKREDFKYLVKFKEMILVAVNI